MTLDLTQFHQVFFEECAEALDGMESGLLGLGAADDSEAINTIFRGAHSIKGGGATFGFTDIAGFTHVMETLLDQVRDGRKKITRPDIDLLLAAVDCLRNLLTAQQNGTAIDAARVHDLKVRLETALVGNAPAAPTVLAAPKPAAAAAVAPAAGDSISEDEFDALLDQLHGQGGTPGVDATAPVWRIRFRPHVHMLQSGNDPLRILRELEALAPVTAHADLTHLPRFEALQPEESHLGWIIELGAGATREKIQEAFAWVEDDCDLAIENLQPETASPQTGHPSPAALASATAPGVALPPASMQSSIPSATPPKESPVTDPTPTTDTASVDSRDGGRSGPSWPSRGITPSLEGRGRATHGAVADTPAPAVSAAATGSAASGESASIRVGIDKIDALINMVGELVITQSMLSQLSENFDMNGLPKLMTGLGQLERNTRELQESVMRIRMLPISFAFNRFPRLVHDLSAKLGKKIELKMTGEQTELDKTVMEKIGDPLVHLVRNSLDHGIEMPAARRAAGKPETGTLHLNAYHQSGNIVIEIVDDGAGLPREKILKKAKERGLIKDDAVLTDAQIYDLIFLPGFSTADTVSDVSGRGVGMDVVRRNIKALGGTVEIRSQEGRGTTITIRLPLTLAILDGQTVRVGNEIYIIPLVSIVESLKIRSEMVNIVAGRGEVIRLRKEYLQVMRLYKVFDAKPHHTNLADGLLVVVEGEGFKAGLYVDELLGQQQIVIKSLEANFKRVEGVAGATILGDGTVALILDVPGLIKLAHRNAVALGVGDVHQPENLAA